MGVVRGNGSLKPAASLLAPQADLTYPAPTLRERWLKPFWLTLAAGMLTSCTILLYATSRRRRRLQ